MIEFKEKLLDYDIGKLATRKYKVKTISAQCFDIMYNGKKVADFYICNFKSLFVTEMFNGEVFKTSTREQAESGVKHYLSLLNI